MSTFTHPVVARITLPARSLLNGNPVNPTSLVMLMLIAVLALGALTGCDVVHLADPPGLITSEIAVGVPDQASWVSRHVDGILLTGEDDSTVYVADQWEDHSVSVTSCESATIGTDGAVICDRPVALTGEYSLTDHYVTPIDPARWNSARVALAHSTDYVLWKTV